MYRKTEWVVRENGCFECTSYAKTFAGYTRMKKDGKRTFMHRHIYEECFGEIPEGMFVMHKCDNPLCINPEHLRLGTHWDNMIDKTIKGRGLKKLSLQDRKFIIDSYANKKMNIYELAGKFNVCPQNISKMILKNKAIMKKC